MTDQTFLDQFSALYRWPSAPAKRRFRYAKVPNKGMVEDNRLALTLGGVIDRPLDDVDGLQASDYSTYQIFEKYDLVFKLIDLENIKTSRVGYVPRRGIMSPAYIRLVPYRRTALSKYYYWFFYGAYINNIFNGMGGGVRQNLTPTDLLEFPIPIPDISTQTSIAHFLDRETARIDQLIEKKRRLSDALWSKRRRVALDIIRQFGAPFVAVSPEAYRTGHFANGWSIQRVKHVVSSMTSGSRGWSDLISEEGELFLQSGNIGRKMEIDLVHAVRIQPQGGAEARRTKVSAGNVLVCITGGRTGAVGFVPAMAEPAYVNQHICLLRPRNDVIVPKLLASFLYNDIGQRQLDFFQYGVKQGLGFSQVGEVKIPIPPRKIQIAILERIDLELQRVDRLIECLAISISSMQEFRASLITSAVTGKIDVTSWSRKESAIRQLDQIESDISSATTAARAAR